MRFAEPNFLWGLFTLPLFALLFVYAYHRRKKLAARFVSLPMLSKLSTSVSPWRRLTKVLLLLLAIAFLFVALARPQWGRKMNMWNAVVRTLCCCRIFRFRCLPKM